LDVGRVEVAADLEMVDALVQAENLATGRAAEPHRGIDDGLQDRAQLELGSTDDTEQIRSRGLLLKQLIAIARKRCNGLVLPRRR
jgi:hypothetical protein